MDPTRFSVRDAGAAKLRRSKTPTTALRPSAIALLTLMMTHRAPGSLQTLTKMLEQVWLDPELDRDHSARPDDRSSATTFSR